MKSPIKALAIALILCFGAADANTGPDLDQLLEEVRRAAYSARDEQQQREAQFAADRATQAERLAQARQALAAEEARSATLQDRFHANEHRLAELEQSLHERQGALGELFGVVRQAAGDTASQLENSLSSAQFPARRATMAALSEQRALPSTEQLEQLWLTLLEEMTEAGKVSRFETTVVTPAGTRRPATVTRLGLFNAIADGRYLSHLPDTGDLVELPRQPAKRYLNQAQALSAAANGEQLAVFIDPSRGALLGQLVQTPTLAERIQQGRWVGYVILLLGLIGLVLFGERLFVLSRTERAIKRQLTQTEADSDNPIGRILTLYRDNRNIDIETLELRLDEAVVREVPRLERGLSTLKLLAAIAPLLGLLGTVVGMIETFQSITLFGTGDPKLMASGISQALVTTALGLLVAIPLLLLLNIVAAKAKRLIGILEEQSTGILAEHLEKDRADGLAT
ncbi:hypothetical protein CAI21_13800 [Alkalilimnicola ehrlichii]|uniref:MotA/TolQ/ExbB proton channel domain-containing protein n=1 Tax=Alkalilimnicola ehrlichii TaxID=351052 RepID=A0A3E0WRN2_9GAMM|nr:MotA/TolQ/ExbB proton channel family protein [Alkalilimnicola ehrlichii]RFA27987.1 hypothetical protein CAI21_13800 [Alkalilimnicola ehrlichii]RFA34636.1 hypothetical protein CAL65_14835 [Alkalilimnicola ehrlichii]